MPYSYRSGRLLYPRLRQARSLCSSSGPGKKYMFKSPWSLWSTGHTLVLKPSRSSAWVASKKDTEIRLIWPVSCWLGVVAPCRICILQIDLLYIYIYIYVAIIPSFFLCHLICCSFPNKLVHTLTWAPTFSSTLPPTGHWVSINFTSIGSLSKASKACKSPTKEKKKKKQWPITTTRHKLHDICRRLSVYFLKQFLL